VQIYVTDKMVTTFNEEPRTQNGNNSKPKFLFLSHILRRTEY